MKRLLLAVVISVAFVLPTQGGDAEAIDAAQGQTVAWLSLTDKRQYEASWESASTLFKAAISKDQWAQSLGAARTPFGALQSRSVASSTFSETLPGAPDGEYVVFQFDASFEHKASAVETVTAMKDSDGVWRVAGYFIK